MKSPGITQERFGATSDQQPVDRYTLINANGLIAKIATYGAMLTELHVPDRHGALADVVLGAWETNPRVFARIKSHEAPYRTFVDDCLILLRMFRSHSGSANRAGRAARGAID